MKKKIITICLVIALAATAIVGASLAYFTDTENETNVFTVGKVDIDLNDQFEQNSPLFPAVLDEDTNEIKNAVDKVVSVTNNEEDAYVRVHIAVPADIDELIGLWYDDADGWDWVGDTRVDYTTTINGVEYNVVCLTYSEILEADETTTDVFEWVTLDPSATNEDVAAFNDSGLNIIIIAEGAQAAGFDNAYDALNAAFGTPSAAENPWNEYGTKTEPET